MTTERMPNPAVLIPGAMPALTAVTASVAASARLDGTLLALSRLRTSQINGCGPGVAGAVHQAGRYGATADQLHAVAAWRHVDGFTDAERAALTLTEAATRLADRPDPVPDRVWDLAATHFDQKELAALLLTVAITNAVDRLDLPTRQRTGSW